MYSRQYGGLELDFEPSGGLVNSSLVMQDKQTDSYWSIMIGESTGGELAGTQLVEMPVSERVQWKDWRQRHPDTLVLSVGGREFADDAYPGYWTSPDGFRGQQADDERLATKESIYAFDLEGRKYAVAHAGIEGGKVIELPNGLTLLLYRAPGATMFVSTAAYVSSAGFRHDGERWVEIRTGARFDPAAGNFSGSDVESFTGFDTFWYNWSLNNPDTELLQ